MRCCCSVTSGAIEGDVSFEYAVLGTVATDEFLGSGNVPWSWVLPFISTGGAGGDDGD